MTGDSGESVKDCKRKAPEMNIWTQLAFWHWQRRSEQLKGESASHEGHSALRPRALTLKHLLSSPLAQAAV
jgi:hypothetical protein